MAVGSSPYELKGVFKISLYFSDIEFPFTKGSHLGIFHMVESSKIDIPMVRVQIIDGIKFFKDNPGILVEGRKLKVSIVARDKADADYNFRINSVHISPSNIGDTVDLDGYLDFPKYWTGTTVQVYQKKTSSDVLKEVAEDAGMEFDGDVTSDSQTWLGAKRRIHTFCRDVANHGYSSEKSCMKFAVCLDGKMLYKDVSQLDVGDPKAKLIIGDIKEDYITVVSHMPKNTGGSSNRKAGYRQTMTEFSTVREKLYRNHSILLADINEGGSFNMNPDVRTAQEDGAHVVGPIDYGNVHDDYHRARYQNIRGTALFNVGLDVLIAAPAIKDPYLRVFDTVSVTMPDEMSEHNGSYIIVSHAIMITNSQYHEKLELTHRAAASEESKSETDDAEYESPSEPPYKDEE